MVKRSYPENQLEKLMQTEFVGQLEDVIIFQNPDNSYELFNTYHINKNDTNEYIVKMHTTFTSHNFNNLKHAVAWCTFDKRNLIYQSNRILKLDNLLAGLEVDISLHTKMFKNAKNSDDRLIFLSKLSEDKLKKRQITDELYKALRGTIEKFAGNTRFVATCNYINKVPDAIQSRFEVINFDPSTSEEEEIIKIEWRSRVRLILGKLGISIDDDSLSAFEKSYFPDFRSALNRIQSWSIEGVTQLDLAKVKEANWSYEDLYKMLMTSKDPVNNYQVLVGQYSTKVDDVMTSLGGEFIDWIVKNHPDKAKIIPATIVLVASHQAQRTAVIDPVVSLLSLFFQIQKLID